MNMNKEIIFWQPEKKNIWEKNIYFYISLHYMKIYVEFAAC